MQKTILITGSTDGIGRETAKSLLSKGHRVLIHGRNAEKLAALQEELTSYTHTTVQGYIADLADLSAVESFAEDVTRQCETLDVLINNAGVFRTSSPITKDGLDVRFVVNTLAPYLLTRRLLPLFTRRGRILNLSSAAQAPVDLRAFIGQRTLSDNAAYAQSKLALTMWSRALAHTLGDDGPAVIAINPGSMLGTKMVKEAYGVQGASMEIGVDILVRAALSGEFDNSSGRYFDNDAGRFAQPHPDARHDGKINTMMGEMESLLKKMTMTV